MSSITSRIKLGLAAGLMFSVLAVAPVFAISGPSDKPDEAVSSDSGTRDKPRSADDTPDAPDQPDDSDGRVRISNSGPGSPRPDSAEDSGGSGQEDKVRDGARKLLEDKRKGNSEKTLAKRQAACERRQAAINRKFSAFDAAANRHLTKIDSTFTKLKDFQSTNKLDVANYDELVAAATDKQTAASESVAVLKTLTADIDCASDDPAANVAASKTAVSTAKTSIKEYRKSVKNLLVALMTAKEATEDNSTTEGTN